MIIQILILLEELKIVFILLFYIPKPANNVPTKCRF